MQITVKLFATYREIVGAKELRIRLSEDATLRALLDSLYAKHPRLKGSEDTMLVAVNHEFAEPTAKLQEGDEVALMPPVSGGAGGFVEVQRKAIDVEVVVASVQRPDAGAVILFLGTVRSDPGVKALDYEVYRPMALRTMAGIVARAKEEFGVLEMTIVHRLGRVPVGRPSVAIACSSAHRREAFAAASWAMDEMKKVVPIWKTEK